MADSIRPVQREVREYVPGKQVSLAHVIASPDRDIYTRLGLDDTVSNALGILTFTPAESVIIAADIATKAGSVEIGYLDRFGGSLLLFGDVASVESAVRAVIDYFGQVLRYTTADITRT